MSRMLGLDLGDVRIGIAVSDELGITAQSLEVYKRKGIVKDREKIIRIIEQYDITRIVIGLPRNMDGTIGPQSNKVLQFVKVLKSYLKVPIITWDERLTTKIAESVLISGNVKRDKRKRIVDMLAAQLILQGYLDYLKR